MKTLALIGMAACAGLFGCAAPPAATPLDEDAAFLQDRARQDLIEIRMGELAQRYAQLPDVAAYGRRMTAEHDESLAALRGIALDRRIALPAAPDDAGLDSYYQLSRIGGDDFHRQYMDRALFFQRGEISTLQREAASGGDARLVAFARDREPMAAGDTALGIDVEVKNHLNFPIAPAGGGNVR